MTNREFFTAVIADTENEKIKNFAIEAIAKLDARNAKRNATPSKKAIENEKIKESIIEFIGADSLLASQVADGLGISTAKASALCRQLVANEKLKVEDTKIKNKGTQKLYSLA